MGVSHWAATVGDSKLQEHRQMINCSYVAMFEF